MLSIFKTHKEQSGGCYFNSDESLKFSVNNFDAFEFVVCGYFGFSSFE